MRDGRTLKWTGHFDISFRESKSNIGIASSQSSKCAFLKPSLEPMSSARQSPGLERLQSSSLRHFSKLSQCPASAPLLSCVTHASSPIRSRTNMLGSASTFQISRPESFTAEHRCKRTLRHCQTKTLTLTSSSPHPVD